MRRLWFIVLLLAASATFAQGPAVAPSPNHPGNIFLQTESISLDVPAGDWELRNDGGQLVKRVHANGGKLDLDRLSIGYYELDGKGQRITFGVIAPLVERPSASSPIALDVAMAWFYPAAKMDDVASLCALAGVNRVRDRLAWGEIEPEKGKFAEKTRYDASAQAQSSAGLRVLTVNHSTPPWAGKNAQRIAPDLRDAYAFYRAIAQRWKGRIAAIEPWNEGDIAMFGGHTGSELATFQKAAYLGLKSGNPDVIACMNVFASQRPAQLEDFDANQAWPYFDTCNLHHYIGIEKYPARYKAFRRICAGRPLWTTEFAMPVQWADEKTKEPSDQDLRIQAQRIPVSFAGAIHEGCAAAYYFLLPDYVEGKTQYGIIHKDLTPRPAYVALAALGRWLAEAKPLGQWRREPGFYGYAFACKPDGKNATVIVAWDWQKRFDLDLPAPAKIVDLYGRQMENGIRHASVTGWPIYIVLPPGSEKQMDLELPPAMPPKKEAKAGDVVLQAALPSTSISLKDSAYQVGAGSVSMFAYNFGQKPARLKLAVECSAGGEASVPDSVEVAAGDRAPFELKLTKLAEPITTVTVHATGDQEAVVSFRVMGGK